MAGERIAHGEVYIEVNDREALARLREIEAKFHRTMQKLDSEEAELHLGADVKALERDLKEAEKKVKDYNKRIADSDNARSKASLERYRREAQAAVDARRADLQSARSALAAEKAANKERDLAAKKIDLIAKREVARTRVLEKAKRDAQRLQDDINRKAAREDARRAREALKAAREAQRAEEALQRELSLVPKIQRRYEELRQTLERLGVARRKATGEGRALFDLKIADVVNDMDMLQKRLERVGATPVKQRVELTLSERAGDKLRLHFFQNNSLAAVAAAAGADLGAHAGRGFRTQFAKVAEKGVAGSMKSLGASVGGAGLRGLAQASGWLGKLSDSTVRLGPFTTTIRKALLGLSVFAPVLVDIIGALGSLVSVMGSATLGATALAGGFLGGAIPATIGFGLVIAGVVKDLGNVTKASKAYNDAVMKYGESSDQAAKKQKELKTVLGNVSEETVAAFQNAGKLRDQWNDLTKPARAEAFNIIGKAITSAGKLMPQFARQTNQGMAIMRRELGEWMDGMSGAEGQSILGSLGRNFNRALGPIMDGLGNIAHYLGRVFSLASNRIPGIARQFESWSEKVLGTSDDLGNLDNRLERTIQSARDVGRFFMEAGRFLKAFFAAGVGAGQGFTRTMSDALHRWTQFMNTTEGQQKVGDFFDRSVKGVQALYQFLAPVVSSFVQWAGLMAPWAAALFKGLGALTSFLQALLRMTALQGPITALATTLGVLWGISRIRNATSAVAGFTQALLGMGAAQKAVQASSAMGGAGRYPLPITMVPGGVAKGAEKITKMGRVATVARGALTGLGGAVLGVSTVTGGLAVAAAAAGVGLYAFSKRTRQWEKDTRAAEQALVQSRTATELLPQIHNDVANSLLDISDSELNLRQIRRQSAQEEKDLAQLRKDGKKGTEEYRVALDQHRMTLNQLSRAKLQDKEAQAALTKAVIEGGVKGMEAVSKAREARAKLMEAFRNAGGDKNVVKMFGEVQKQARAAGKSIGEYLDSKGISKDGPLRHLRNQFDILTRLNGATRNLKSAYDSAALSSINLSRTVRKLPALTSQAQKALTGLRQVGGTDLAVKVGVKFGNPTQVAKSATAALKSGVPRNIVMKIVADSRSAEAAIRALDSVKFTPKILAILASDKDAKSKIKALIAAGIPPKVAEMLGDNTDAINKARQVNAQKLKNLVQRIARTIANPANLFSPLPAVTQPVKRVPQGMGRSRMASGGVAGVAGGGETAGTRAAMDRALVRADQGTLPQSSTTQMSRGAKVNGPRAIYGEEPQHPEYVITSNPTYRQSNIQYLRQAAAALGVTMAAKGRGPVSGLFDPGSDKVLTTGAPKRPAIGPYRAGQSIKRTVRKSKRKGQRGAKLAMSGRRSWATYVEGLEQRQDYLEREVSFRESNVREPTEMVVTDGMQVVTNPETGQPITDEKGKVVEVPKYKANPDIEAQYIPDLKHVREAMDELVSVIQARLEAIPHAISSINLERGYRKVADNELKSQIATARKRVSKAKDGDAKDKAKRQLDKLLDARKENDDTNKALLGDRKSLRESYVDAAFDKKESERDRKRISDEIDGALGRETKSASEQTSDALKSAQESGSSGGSEPDNSHLIDQANERARVAERNSAALSGAIRGMTSPGDIGTGNFANAFAAAMQMPSFSSAAGVTMRSGRTAAAAVSGSPSPGRASSGQVGSTADIAGAGTRVAGGGSAIAPGNGPTIINNINTLHPGDPRTLAAVAGAAAAGFDQQGAVISPRVNLGA